MTARARAALEVLAGLSAGERSGVLEAEVRRLGPGGLAACAVAWFAALDELAKRDPVEAGRLAAAMWAHLGAHRPESPAPLDAGFVPTEPVRDPRCGEA